MKDPGTAFKALTSCATVSSSHTALLGLRDMKLASIQFDGCDSGNRPVIRFRSATDRFRRENPRIHAVGLPDFLGLLLGLLDTVGFS